MEFEQFQCSIYMSAVTAVLKGHSPNFTYQDQLLIVWSTTQPIKNSIISTKKIKDWSLGLSWLRFKT